MGRARVFIDGHAGTTGLRIRDWLVGREDELELLWLPEAERKDPGARRELSNSADLVVLCLPDDAARDAAGGISNAATRVLDASTAHRVADGWVYGLPEMTPAQRGAIAGAQRVTNPGCYASAFVLLVRPLLEAGLLVADAPLAIHALSGYSGGGRELIERWQHPDRGLLMLPFEAPYALERVHKHLPEMHAYSGLERAPQFAPAVGPFRCGMRIQIPLHAALLAPGASGKAIWEALDARYRDERFVVVHPFADPIETHEQSFDPRACNDTNRLEITVAANPAGHALLLAVLDNLGKGAAGMAIQNLNLMLGLPEERGLPV
jgi:N-acetyl-gamma-glutamyl-phosphate reductase